MTRPKYLENRIGENKREFLGRDSGIAQAEQTAVETTLNKSNKQQVKSREWDSDYRPYQNMTTSVSPRPDDNDVYQIFNMAFKKKNSLSPSILVK